MSDRTRLRTDPPPGLPGNQPDGEGADLDRIRQRARDIAAAGDEAIARVLSGDSQAFLKASEQQGGQ